MKRPLCILGIALAACIIAAGCTSTAEPSEPEDSNSSKMISEVSSQISENSEPEPSSAVSNSTDTTTSAPTTVSTPPATPAPPVQPAPSTPAPSQPQQQYFDQSLLSGIGSCMLYPGYNQGRYDISANAENTADRITTFLSLIPAQNLVIVDAPASFDQTTAVQLLGGDSFDYYWYIQPDYTYFTSSKSGVSIYTTSSQTLYDTMKNMPASHPELFDNAG